MYTSLGIIGGAGNLPQILAKRCLQLGYTPYVAAIDGDSDIKSIECFEHQIFKISSVGAILNYFTKNQVRNIVCVGSVTRVEFKLKNFDFEGAKLVSQILLSKSLSDDNILRVIATFLEKRGFKVIAATDILNNNLNLGTVTNIAPSARDLEDINIGIKLLNTISKFNVGQALIISEGLVLGIEGPEGTDELIARCIALRAKNNKNSGGILVKSAKISQDKRLDIPTVGFNTITHLARGNYNGLALDSSCILIENEEQMIQCANEHKVFIFNLSPPIHFEKGI